MYSVLSDLKWDSKFFGAKVGSLYLENNLDITRQLKQASSLGFQLVYIYAREAISEHVIGSFLLQDVGGQITYSKDVNNAFCPYPSEPHIHEFLQSSLNDELLQLAFLSGHLSRFWIDPLLPVECYETMYEIWMKKTLLDRPNSSIYTYQESGVKFGLITGQFKNSKCAVGLLAISPGYRGRGIGSKLLRQLEYRCLAQNIYNIEVKTQISNVAANNLYLKNSFYEQDRAFLYHAHLKGANPMIVNSSMLKNL